MDAATTRFPGVDDRQDAAGAKNAAGSPNGQPEEDAGNAIQRLTTSHPENTETNRRGTGGNGVPRRHPGQDTSSSSPATRNDVGKDATAGSDGTSGDNDGGGNQPATATTSRAGSTAVPRSHAGKDATSRTSTAAVPGDDPSENSTTRAAGAKMNASRM